MMRPGRSAALLAVLAPLAALLAAAPPVGAGGPLPLNYPVTTNLDVVDAGDGVLSLREAISQANADTTVDAVVTLQNGVTYTLTRCQEPGTDDNSNVDGDLDHNDPEQLRIDGNGSTIRQQCSFERLVDKNSATGTLLFEDVILRDGYGTSNGGAVQAAGPVQLDRTTVKDNLTDQNGGGIAAGGLLRVFDSTIRDNFSLGSGGGAYTSGDLVSVGSTWTRNVVDTSGGAFRALGTSVVNRSTLTRNRAETAGGGLHGSGTVDLRTATVLANRAPVGANVQSETALALVSSVVGLGSGGTDCSGSGTFTSSGQNVGHDGTCVTVSDMTDTAYNHPMVAPLASNGGLTETMRPVAPSPALNRDPAPCLGDSTGQNGPVRPQGSGCESGSFEGPTPPCTPPAFSDVGTGHPFFADICWLSRMGIAGGFPDGTYKPSQAVTRQSMSAFIFRLAGSPLYDAPNTPSFTDVAADSTFFTEIEWMADEEITGGFPDDTFRPNQPVTRQAMAAFLFRVAGEPFSLDPPPSFSDVPADHSFFHEIEWLAASGVTGGFSDGTFRPNQAVTRQAMAAFLERMAELVYLAGL